MSDKNKLALPTVTIETVDGAWILREKGKEAKAIFRWDALIRELEERITTKDKP